MISSIVNECCHTRGKRAHKMGCAVGKRLRQVAAALAASHGWPERYAYHVADQRWRRSRATQGEPMTKLLGETAVEAVREHGGQLYYKEGGGRERPVTLDEAVLLLEEQPGALSCEEPPPEEETGGSR